MSVANIGMLQEPFRKRKWCLRDFADTQEGLRNHFATKSYSRRAAKLASTLMFSASNLWHISGNFRRKYTLLYKKAAKSFRNKRVISQHFAKCFLQLGVIGLQWLQLLRFNSELCTIWSIGFLTSWALKWYIACINWTSESAPKVATMTVIKNMLHGRFSLLFLLAFRIYSWQMTSKICPRFLIILLNLELLWWSNY